MGKLTKAYRIEKIDPAAQFDIQAAAESAIAAWMRIVHPPEQPAEFFQHERGPGIRVFLHEGQERAITHLDTELERAGLRLVYPR